MAVLKWYNPDTLQWERLAVGEKGEKGDQGDSVIGTLQEVTDLGNSTTNPISHADGVNPEDSATLGQLDSAIGAINQSLPDGLLDGGIVVWKETGYDYEVSTADIREDGVRDLVDGIDFTLAVADPTLPRKDTIAVSLQFGFEVLQGTPAVDPIEPQAIPPRIRLTAIDIAAGSTAPIAVNTVVAYKENLEYPITHSGFGTSDADNLENPFEGAKAIKVSPVQNNSTTIATAPADITVADITSVSFRLALIESFANGHNIAIEFRNAADAPVSNQVVLSIDKTTTLYQFVAFALDSFTFTSPTFRKIAIIFRRTGNQSQRGGYYIDNWILQGGIETPPVAEDVGDMLSSIYDPANGARQVAFQDELGFQEATILESNTIPFDKNYIIGNAGARSGNILFDFTGAKLGAWTEMRHNDATAFTFPTECMFMFDIADISTTADNYYLFQITDSTPSSEVVKVFHALEGGI